MSQNAAWRATPGELSEPCHYSMLMLMRFGLRSANHLATCFGAMVLVAACGGGDGPAPLAPPPPPPSDSGPPTRVYGDGGGAKLQQVGSSCVEPDIKDCKVLLPAHGSIHPCFIGVQICVGGKWGPCGDPPKDAGPAGDGSSVK